MDVSTYAVEASVEAEHWWFTGRRALFSRLIASFALARDANVLDIGTSTGTNLRMLRELGFSHVSGLDPSDEAIRWCSEKGLGVVTKGDVCNVPFPDASFDLVLATDVIEHVDDDARALAEIYRVLKPGAPLLLTVPAFQSLWGLQDEVSQHKRRYRAGEVRQRMTHAGFDLRRAFYFNFFLFLPIMLARTAIRMTGTRLKSENELNSPLVNAVLKSVFRADVALAPHLHVPFGVSYLAVGMRAAQLR